MSLLSEHVLQTMTFLEQFRYCQTHGISGDDLIRSASTCSNLLIGALNNPETLYESLPFLQKVLDIRTYDDYIHAHNSMLSFVWSPFISTQERRHRCNFVTLFLGEHFKHPSYLKQGLYNIADYTTLEVPGAIASVMDILHPSNIAYDDHIRHVFNGQLPDTFSLTDYSNTLSLLFLEYTTFPMEELLAVFHHCVMAAKEDYFLTAPSFYQIPLQVLKTVAKSTDIRIFEPFYDHFPLSLLSASLPAVITPEIAALMTLDSDLTLTRVKERLHHTTETSLYLGA